VLTTPDASDAEAHQHQHQTEKYDREYGAYRQYRLDNWQRSYIRRLAPLWAACGPTAPFLDAGAGGSAYTVIEAARSGIPAVGCDISLEGMRTAAAFARAEGVADHCLFVACSAERLPFTDRVFGGAAAIAVLEHVPDERRAIGELARVTRPGGQVFIAVPNSVERMPFPLRQVYQWHDRRVGHLRHYSPEELRERSAAAGLEPVRVVYSGHWSKVWQLALHLPATRLGLNDQRLWWWLEGFDDRAADNDRGLHLNLWLDRR
jgi:ubiquinone/menaquinone biosynthesis C-methylase UbiE